jgi:hypothetical protein
MKRGAKANKVGPAKPTAAAGIQPLFNIALRYLQDRRLGDAERLLRQVLSVDPRHSDSLHLLGVLAYQTGRKDLAKDLIGKAIAINPKNASLHSNLGNLLLEQGRVDQAVASYRRALALEPNFPEAFNNLGNALRALKELDQAIGCYRQALDLRPDDAETHYNLSMALLAQGDMAAGWPEHEWRWSTPHLKNGRRSFAQPQWRGEAAEGRTLLVHAEQGFGDTLQFCRYVPMAAERGLRIILEVPRTLTRLLRSLPHADRIAVQGDTLPPFDLHCPLLSMPLALGTTIATIPNEVPYLRAEAIQTEAWRARLVSLATHGPKIGLAWAGNPRTQVRSATAVGRWRSITPDRLAPVFEPHGLHFFSLQKDGAAPPQHFPLVDFMSEMEDFADTAALVANLDLIISVDTSVAHLAAALGKPVWLLTCFDPCWRWLAGRRDSPWYPGLRLYQQPRPGDWDSVLTEVAGDLHSLTPASSLP